MTHTTSRPARKRKNSKSFNFPAFPFLFHLKTSIAFCKAPHQNPKPNEPSPAQTFLLTRWREERFPTLCQTRFQSPFHLAPFPPDTNIRDNLRGRWGARSKTLLRIVGRPRKQGENKSYGSFPFCHLPCAPYRPPTKYNKLIEQSCLFSMLGQQWRSRGNYNTSIPMSDAVNRERKSYTQIKQRRENEMSHR